MAAEAIVPFEGAKERELLGEACPGAGTIQAQPLELRLDATPGFHEHPGRRSPVGPERHEALQAIDEEKSASLLRDDEWEAGIDGLPLPGGLAELERDLLEGNLADAHGRPSLRALGRIERTW